MVIIKTKDAHGIFQILMVSFSAKHERLEEIHIGF
jgi:hypothetical protein